MLSSRTSLLVKLTSMSAPIEKKEIELLHQAILNIKYFVNCLCEEQKMIPKPPSRGTAQKRAAPQFGVKF